MDGRNFGHPGGVTPEAVIEELCGDVLRRPTVVGGPLGGAVGVEPLVGRGDAAVPLEGAT